MIAVDTNVLVAAHRVDAAVISISIPSGVWSVTVRVFDVRGRLVRDLQEGVLPAGEHRFVWRGEDEQGAAVASGVYVYRVDAPGIAASRKLVVAK